MKTLLQLFFLACISANAFAQSTIIFRPSGGSNDGSDTGGATNGKDSWVYEGDAGTNFGTDPYIQGLPISNCNATHCEAFIQFDLTSLPAAVESVHFVVKHLAHTTYCYSGCNADFYFAYVTQPWDEMTINYNNFPARGADFYGPINVTFPNDFGVVEYDITTAYLAWKSGSINNYGFNIYSPTIDCNNAAVYFNVSSSDAVEQEERPYLKIVESNTGTATAGSGKLHCNAFPNPAGDQLNIVYNLNTTQPVSLTLTDISGRIVYAANMLQNSGEQILKLPLNNLQPGFLFYTLVTAEGSATGKAVIEK